MTVVEVGDQKVVAASADPVFPLPHLVDVQGITKIFGTGSEKVTALDDISLAVGASEFFTLLGPSGCGKTTLLRLLAGFVHADQGVVLLDGRHVADDPPNKRPVNTVFQSYALFPHMSVAQNIAFGLERQGLPRHRIKERVGEMLRLVRLESLATRRPNELSGGQQQRVALARALAPGPKLLLLDEPLSALDLKLRRSMQLELKRLQRETGVTFLLVTHDQEEAFSVSDRIAVMDQGRILQIGTPHDIYARPCCSFVADFTGANVVPGHLAGLSSLHAAIRPEDVILDVEGSGLKGRVVDFTYLGAKTSCVIALDAGPTLIAERDNVPSGLAPGAPVTCRFVPGTPVELES